MACNETIKSIIAEMRGYADTDSQSVGRDVLRRDIQHLADRIETVYKREVVVSKNATTTQESLGVGNGAKMREALQTVLDELLCLAPRIIYIRGGKKGAPPWAIELCLIVRAALDAPSRNCDRYPTFAAAIDAWREVDPRDAGAFDEWIFAEAKGETDGNE